MKVHNAESPTATIRNTGRIAVTEPMELYIDETYEVFDPNTARQVAVFYHREDAERYLEWRNYDAIMGIYREAVYYERPQ